MPVVFGALRSVGLVSVRANRRQFRIVAAYVLNRDKRVCWLCGLAGADTVDHVQPVARGGNDEPSNLRAAHRACNSARGARGHGTPNTTRDW